VRGDRRKDVETAPESILSGEMLVGLELGPVAHEHAVHLRHARLEEGPGQLLDATVPGQPTVVQRDGRVRGDPGRGAEEVRSLGGRVPPRSAVVDHDDALRMETATELLGQRAVDRHERGCPAAPAALEAGKEAAHRSGATDVATRFHEDLVAVVYERATIASSRVDGGWQPGQIVAVVDVAGWRPVGGRAGPSDDRERPPAEVLDASSAGPSGA